jgi:hypothetical protein
VFSSRGDILFSRRLFYLIERIKTNVYQTRFKGGAWTSFIGVILYCRSRKKLLSIHGIHHPYPQKPLFSLHVFEQQLTGALQGSNLLRQLPVAPVSGTGAGTGAGTGRVVGAAVAGAGTGVTGAGTGRVFGAAVTGAGTGVVRTGGGVGLKGVILLVLSRKLGDPLPALPTKPRSASARILSAIWAGVSKRFSWRSKAATPAT